MTTNYYKKEHCIRTQDNDLRTPPCIRYNIVMRLLLILTLLTRLIYSVVVADDASYQVGIGIYDVTGPVAQVNFMGYAMPQQTGHGLHIRLRSRAFIISSANDEGKVVSNNTICFVSVDCGMGSDLVTSRVLDRLSEILPNEICTIENLSISGTHTHSGPAGFLQYVLYQFTSLGFVSETIDTFVEGISQSISRAYSNIKPTTILYNNGLLFDANINRSPTSYLNNPKVERDRYQFEGDTDKNMLLLKFISKEENKDRGMLNWYAVHGTSMNNTNLLVSGDNKGYASYLAEKHFNGESTLPGSGNFVAAFASTNLGDVSPNTAGAKCIDTGLPCEPLTSTCNGDSLKCIGSGPGSNMFESTEIIGRKQFNHAVGLYNKASNKIIGAVGYRHSFVDMSNQEVILKDGKIVKTCPAALGYSFAGGTTDGPGSGQFMQGTTDGNLFWDKVAEFIAEPTEVEKACQKPKPILLNTGKLSTPYLWDPPTVPISIFRVGNLFILNVPCEFTTMAGRRLRDSVKSIVVENGVVNATITIAGLSNSYVHYVTTFEEYQAQRYEAASTLYGPHTLEAYIQNFERITRDLLNNNVSVSDSPPPNLSGDQISLLPPVILDRVGIFSRFGGVNTDARKHYNPGENVMVSFNSANPRNNQRIEASYLTIERLNSVDNWMVVYVDGDWCTKFAWEMTDDLGSSVAHITWSIPQDELPGYYRVCHYGTRKIPYKETEKLIISTLSSWGFRGGSYGAGVVAKLLSYIQELSPWYSSEFKDFQGCSSSFKVGKDEKSNEKISSIEKVLSLLWIMLPQLI